MLVTLRRDYGVILTNTSELGLLAATKVRWDKVPSVSKVLVCYGTSMNMWKSLLTNRLLKIIMKMTENVNALLQWKK